MTSLGESQGPPTMRRTAFPLRAVLIVTLATLSAGAAAQKQDASPAKANAAPLPERIWRDPGDIGSLDLLYGVGGKAHAPDPAGTYTFLREELRGRSPKFDVVDGQGVVWRVKVGSESRPETAATRFLWAAGYFVDEDYLLTELRVQGLPRLRRGQQFVSPGGVVHNARLERRLAAVQKFGHWDWFDNPFLDQRELNGLRVMMALLNSWDLKTVNNAVYLANGEREYAVSDLGSSFGRSGRDGIASKGEPRDFAEAEFIRTITPESVDFVLHSRPLFLAWVFRHSYYSERTRMERIATQIPRADARWLGDRLSKLTDDQIRDAFRAAGFEPADIETLTRAMRQRIAALEAL
jgi:hypothetical protein